ncbi:MAG: hypothetical protein BWY15_00520 [Firmicutes bacterium ADurb.Bin193]|nr:MAG: hypothetical protein BWY15_00520 [Firmicutes bacterium ADurb.Bin193]
MFPLYTTVLLFIKIILAFFLLYIFLPSKTVDFDEYADEWIDKIFISMVHGHFGIIILVHLLVSLKIYETISLFIIIAILLIAYFIMYQKRGAVKIEDAHNKSVPAFLLDLADGRLGLLGNFKKTTAEYLKAIPSKLKSLIVHAFVHPFDGILMVGLLSAALALRLRHAINYLYYGASDCYVHLAWTKYLNINQIYRDGVYPYGYEAIVSALNKLFFIDPASLIRFFGAIGSFLLVLSVYYILKKNLKNQYAIIFAGVFVFALGTEFPDTASNIWRQLSALPQEYATVFLLPGIHFLNLFYNTGRKKYLALAAEVLAITVFIHFYAAVAVGVAYVFISLFHIRKLFYGKTFGQVVLFMSSAGIIGLTPILIALSLGMKFHQLSYGYVSESAAIDTGLDWKVEIFRFTETNRTLLALLICAALIIVFAIIRLAFKKTPEYTGKIKLFLGVAFLNLAVYTQIRALDIGFFSVMEAYRASTFLVLTTAVLYAFTVYLIEFIPLHRLIRYILKLGGSALIIAIAFNINNTDVLFARGAKLEYDETAYIYYKIKEEFPILNWTIVSTVEQYSQSMGYGWHYNLWEFVKDTQVEPKEEVVFPTDYLFIVVEKRPLNQAEPYYLTEHVSPEDAEQPFPEVGNVMDRYYTNYNNRRIIEAKAYFWAEDYMNSKGQFTVYFENDILKVYMLKQDGTKPINLAQRAEEVSTE